MIFPRNAHRRKIPPDLKPALGDFGPRFWVHMPGTPRRHGIGSTGCWFITLRIHGAYMAGTYTAEVTCYNCSQEHMMEIPKGVTTERFATKTICPNCECIMNSYHDDDDDE